MTESSQTKHWCWWFIFRDVYFFFYILISNKMAAHFRLVQDIFCSQSQFHTLLRWVTLFSISKSSRNASPRLSGAFFLALLQGLMFSNKVNSKSFRTLRLFLMQREQQILDPYLLKCHNFFLLLGPSFSTFSHPLIFFFCKELWDKNDNIQLLCVLFHLLLQQGWAEMLASSPPLLSGPTGWY